MAIVVLYYVAPVSATGYTLGGKDIWLKYCTGQGEGFDEKSSKAICHTALLMYWGGYTHSQHDRNEKLVLCPSTLNSSIVDAFVMYLNETEFKDKIDFIHLANGYFRKNSQCK